MTDNILELWRSALTHRTRIVYGLLLAAGLALVILHAHKLWFYTEEDAYILARYVRNLAAGDGLVYNPGEREWGCTTTLLPLLLAPLSILGITPVLGAKLVGTASVAAVGFVLVRTTGRHAPAALSTLVLWPIAAFGPLLLWAVGGLETALFAALAASALASALGEREMPARRVPASALLLVLATLARNDAPLYAPAVLLAGWNGDWRRSLRWSLAFGAGFAVVWGAHIAYYDAWLPNSYLSKVRGIPNKESLGDDYLQSFASEMRPVVFATVAAVVLVLTRAGARRRDALPLVVALVSCIVYTRWTGGDWMPGYRFLAPTVLFAAPLLIWAVGAAEEWIPRTRRWVRAGCVLALGALSLSLARADTGWLSRLHVLRTANDVFLRVGSAARGGDPSLTYALVDIGGFGWESHARVLDLRGLTDHTIASATQTASGPLAREALERRHPDVILVKSYLASDAPLLDRYYRDIVKLDSQPLTAEDMAALLAHPLSRGDYDAAEYIKAQGDFRIVNIPVFPHMGQFYVVAARQSAIARLPTALASARFNTGNAYYVTGQRQLGLRMIEGELAANPYDEAGRLEQSLRLLTAHRAADARAVLEELVALAPYNADAWNNLGFALGSEGRYREAVPPLETALRLTPEHSLARNNLNWVRSLAR